MMDRVCTKLTELGFICYYGGRNGPIYSYKAVNKDMKFCIVFLHNKQNNTVILQDYWVEAYRRYRKMEDVTELGEALNTFLKNIEELEKLIGGTTSE